MSGRIKIGLVGAGQIGGTLAHLLALKGFFDIAIVDINAGTAQGKALDLSQSSSIEHFESKIVGSADYSVLEGSQVVIVTAGLPRKAGMSRDDLLNVNANIVRAVGEGIKEHAKGAFVIVITNPLDAMVYLMQKVTGFNSKMVVGMAGVLDTARFKYFLATELGVSPSDVSGFVLGGHGDTMVPVIRYTSVAGIPLPDIIKMGMISQEKVNEIIARTRDGGAEVVKLLGNGSAFYSPAESAIEMAMSYLFDKKRILPSAVMLNGEYGLKDIYVGVPAIIGKAGVEKVIELDLNVEERKMFDSSVAAVDSLIKAL